MAVLIVIDIQKEYITPGRDFYLKGIEPSLANANKVLAFARQQQWHIVHVQHVRKDPQSSVWNRSSGFCDFVPGFEPLANETHILKHQFSCYSAPEFVKYIEEYKNEALYMIGYNTRMCCLSTAVEGYHRGHIYHVISDATLAKATEQFSETDMHGHMLAVTDGVFAKVINTATVLEKHATK